jgi:hypothetical protein
MGILNVKKAIDIEKLLQWAMREELPKGNAVTDDVGGIIARRFRAGTLGIAASLSQRGGERDTMGFVPGAPHEDAVRVGDAVHSLDDYARFKDRADVLALFGDLAGIAGDAVDAILKASFDQRSIVISKAVQSTRPKWDFETPTPYRMMVPFRDAAGALRERPLVHGTDDAGDIVYLHPRRGRAAMRDGVYDVAMSPRSPLQWGNPSMISIGHARAEYVAWHTALVALATSLRDRLVEFEPTMPIVRAAPWITGQAVPSRVLSDGKSFSSPLSLAPKRKAPGRPIESEIEARARRAPAEYARALRKRKACGIGLTVAFCAGELTGTRSANN